MNFFRECGIRREDSRLFQVVSNSKFVSVGVRSPNEINALRIYYF